MLVCMAGTFFVSCGGDDDNNDDMTIGGGSGCTDYGDISTTSPIVGSCKITYNSNVGVSFKKILTIANEIIRVTDIYKVKKH